MPINFLPLSYQPKIFSLPHFFKAIAIQSQSNVLADGRFLTEGLITSYIFNYLVFNLEYFGSLKPGLILVYCCRVVMFRSRILAISKKSTLFWFFNNRRLSECLLPYSVKNDMISTLIERWKFSGNGCNVHP